MSGVAREEYASITDVIAYQPRILPELLVQDSIREVVGYAENVAYAAIPLRPSAVGRAIPYRPTDQPQVTAINRGDAARLGSTDSMAAPSRLTTKRAKLRGM